MATVSKYSVTPLKFIFDDKTIAELVKDYLPKLPRYHVSLRIESDISIINGIRRVIIEEIPTWIMTCQMTTIMTNSVYTSDFILDRLHMTPINYVNGLEGSIDILNTSTETITVYTTDIEMHAKEKKIDPRDVCDKIRLCKLDPGEYINIPEIICERVVGTHGGESTLATNIEYNIVDEKEGMYVVDFAFDTVGNSDGVSIIPTACDVLINRLINVKDFLDSGETVSDKYKLTLSELYNELIIDDEDHTLGNIIAKSIYLTDPKIDIVNYLKIHPTEQRISIKWIHESGIDIVMESIVAVVKKLEKIKAATLK